MTERADTRATLRLSPQAAPAIRMKAYRKSSKSTTATWTSVEHTFPSLCKPPGPVRISGAAFGNHDVEDAPGQGRTEEAQLAVEESTQRPQGEPLQRGPATRAGRSTRKLLKPLPQANASDRVDRPSAHPIAARVEPARPAAEERHLPPEVLKPSHAPASLTDASEQGGDTFQDEAPYDVPGAVSDSARDGHREPARQDNFVEPQKSSASQWSAFKYLEGIEVLEDMPNFIIAEALEGAKPAGYANSFEWCKHLAQNPAEILEALTKANLLQKLVQGLTKQMETLLRQAAATSAELNNKFLADGDALLEFGNRDLFDKGLVDWIGAAFPQSALL